MAALGAQSRRDAIGRRGLLGDTGQALQLSGPSRGFDQGRWGFLVREPLIERHPGQGLHVPGDERRRSVRPASVTTIIPSWGS